MDLELRKRRVVPGKRWVNRALGTSTATGTHTLVMQTQPTVRADALEGGGGPSVGSGETQDGNGAHPHNFQFSEESVSSLEPSLSASIFRRWCRGFQGELILGELRTGKVAVSALELPGPEMESPDT